MSKQTEVTKPRSNARSETQRQSILDAASLLFIEKGFGGTNMNDIADALGITRTAVYYYFPSKEAILEALTEEVTEKASLLARSVSGRDQLPPEEALRQLIVQHAQLILTHPIQFRVVERSESSLPEKRRAAAKAARRSVLEHFVHVIQRGIDGGAFQVPDARVAALSIIGMCNWTAWWFDPQADTPAEQVAFSLAAFGLRALAADTSARSTSIEHSIRLLRDDLAVLEAQLKAARSG